MFNELAFYPNIVSANELKVLNTVG